MSMDAPTYSVSSDRRLAEVGFDIGHLAALLEDVAKTCTPDDHSREAYGWLRVEFIAELLFASAAAVQRIGYEMEVGR